MDGLKVFNDSLGQAAGDGLLMQIAHRLTASLRDADTVCRPRPGDNAGPLVGQSTLARPGGDEFTVLIEELHDPSDAIRVSERIQQRLPIPFDLNSQPTVLPLSFGIAFSSN